MALKLLLWESQEEQRPKDKGQSDRQAKVQWLRLSNGLPIYVELQPILRTTLCSCCPKVWLQDLILTEQVVSVLSGEGVKSMRVRDLSFRGAERAGGDVC